MIDLSPQQQQLLDGEAGLPCVRDPRTNKTYVLVPAEQYNRIKDLLEPGPLTEAERRTILEGVWRRANWDDPRMEVYDAMGPG